METEIENSKATTITAGDIVAEDRPGPGVLAQENSGEISTQETPPAQPELPATETQAAPPPEPGKKKVRGSKNSKPTRWIRAPKNPDGSIAAPNFSDLPGQGTRTDPSSSNAQDAGNNQGELSPAPSGPPVPDKYRVNAELTFGMSVAMLTMVFGEEWQPRPPMNVNGMTIDEKENVVGALERYYRTKDMPDIPPGWLCAFAVVTYAAPRFQAPKTKEKVAVIWIRTKGFFGKMFSRLWKRRKFTPQVVQSETPQPEATE